MHTTLDFTALPEDQQLACYGAFLAIAAVDGAIDREELVTVFETLDLATLSPEGQARIRTWLADPPDLRVCLRTLAGCDATLRYGVMVHLTDVTLADDAIVDEEQRALDEAREILGVTDDQARAIVTFLREVRRIRARGLDDAPATEALKSAASSLSAVGVPIAAVYFSGSVVGLSAAGITSGLAALGLGLGMVPGIGVAILIGVATYSSVRWALGLGRAQKQAALSADRERRAQLVVRNLQDAIDHLLARIAALAGHAAQAEANADAIARLTQRLHALQQALARRQS